MLRAGVDRGVERGVETAERNVIGRESCLLRRFSFSSGTVRENQIIFYPVQDWRSNCLPSTIMQAILLTRPIILAATRQYCPSSSGKILGIDREARFPSNCCRWSVDLSCRIFPSFSQNTFGSGIPSTWHSSVIASPSQQRKSFKCLTIRGSDSKFLITTVRE